MTTYIYRHGNQQVQKEGILECAGAKPTTGHFPTPTRLEAEYRVATAEEYAKKFAGKLVPFTVAGAVYTVEYKS